MQNRQKTPFFLVTLYMVCIITMIVFFFSDNLQKTNYVVNGISMLPTFKPEQKLVYDNRNINVERFDCIVFVDYKNNTNIKRVYGLPGETIQIKDNIIYINNVPIEDVVVYNDKFDGGVASKEFKLHKNEYFVLGDNRDYSIDSRHKELGTINKKMIIGIIKED